MNAWAGRRGRGAQIDSFRGSAVEPARGPQQELLQIGCSSADIAADQIRIVTFKAGGFAHAALQDEAAEPWRESFDLPLDDPGHIHVRSVGNVTIGPGGMFSRGGA